MLLLHASTVPRFTGLEANSISAFSTREVLLAQALLRTDFEYRSKQLECAMLVIEKNFSITIVISDCLNKVKAAALSQRGSPAPSNSIVCESSGRVFEARQSLGNTPDNQIKE